jgi:transketolase
MTEKKMVNPRNAYGEALIELGKKHKNLVVLDADLSKSTKTIMFAKKYPERFFEMGIAEANMMTTAAALHHVEKFLLSVLLLFLQQVEYMIKFEWILHTPLQM